MERNIPARNVPVRNIPVAPPKPPVQGVPARPMPPKPPVRQAPTPPPAVHNIAPPVATKPVRQAPPPPLPKANNFVALTEQLPTIPLMHEIHGELQDVRATTPMPKASILETAPDDLPAEVIRDATTKLAGQVSLTAFNALSPTAQLALHNTLNAKRTQVFVPCVERYDLISQVRLRLQEARDKQLVQREPIGGQLWCPYCASYRHFKSHSFTGYDKCVGCGISTADFDVAIDNRLHNTTKK